MKKQEFLQQIQDSPLAKHQNQFENLLKSTVRILPSRQEESEIPIGVSKIGGRPDLPEDISWPTENDSKPLSFIAQINLSETSGADSDNLLPKVGILYFFYSTDQEAWGFDPKDKDKFKVVFYDGNPDKLKRLEHPELLPADTRFDSCKVSFNQEVSWPSWQSGLLDFLTPEEQDLFYGLVEEGQVYKMLGHSDVIQNEMELECELVTNGIYCGNETGYEDPRSKELEKNIGEWQLLLQVDSSEETGMMWGDIGRIYYWIRKKDLQQEKFENAWLILQCS